VDSKEVLNEAQKQAVFTTQGPLLVLAGAGAGKTRVIAHRIEHIVKSGVTPESILAITFTNKAAAEMRERVQKLLRDDTCPFVSTFHSLGLTLIKENAKALGLRRAPSIYDRADSLRAIKEALKSLGAEGELEPRAALSVISRLKGDGIGREEFNESAQNSRERLIARVWQRYEAALRQEVALDFDDLLLRAVELLRGSKELRGKYQHRWRYLHIDEYQDTNRVQSELANLLVGVERNICAVGDVDQTIYTWRGAEIANILSFERTYPGAAVVVLEENYRSTKTILAAANDIIVKNVFRPEKNLFTRNDDGRRLSLYQAFDETDEALFIARKIDELRQSGVAPQDIAVLYRANFQSRAIEEALLAAEIPYQVVGTRFFERKEVKDVLSFVRAALYGAAVDIARVANTPPRGLGKVTLLKMLTGREGELSPAFAAKVRQFKNILQRINDAAQKLSPPDLIQFVLQTSGMEKMLKADKLEGQERLENLRELATLASRHQSLESFLEAAALASDQDELNEERNAVRLMTVHASKGLEFTYVFIAGLEEGLFPYAREEERGADKEEERRLMYVALTRAKERVFLSYASYRTVFGSKNPTFPSQFLNDISEELIELESPERLGKTIYLQ
jgi:DNA helicase-2/ATP-dependent DNA helicase PcrA